MTEHPEWETWLGNQEDWNGDQYYRGVYAAYLAALRPRDGDTAGYCRVRAAPDGGFLLSTNDHYEPLPLADEAQCHEFAQWLENRLCRTVPNMRAWEAERHRWYVDDRSDWHSF